MLDVCALYINYVGEFQVYITIFWGYGFLRIAEFVSRKGQIFNKVIYIFVLCVFTT